MSEPIYAEIKIAIEPLHSARISPERIILLQPLIDYIQTKSDVQKQVRLNLICTHNSRRSHFAQIWAQTAAAYYGIKNVTCYSGGTEATAVFPLVVQTLQNSGFRFQVIANGSNPIYSIKYSQNQHPVIAFSKRFDDDFNPKSEIAAILTCSQADGDCPFIAGAEQRIAVPFDDPKAFDNTPQQDQKYLDCSLLIAIEMLYVFSQINKNNGQ